MFYQHLKYCSKVFKILQLHKIQGLLSLKKYLLTALLIIWQLQLSPQPSLIYIFCHMCTLRIPKDILLHCCQTFPLILWGKILFISFNLNIRAKLPATGTSEFYPQSLKEKTMFIEYPQITTVQSGCKDCRKAPYSIPVISTGFPYL